MYSLVGNSWRSFSVCLLMFNGRDCSYIVKGKTNFLALKWNHIIWMFHSKNSIYIHIMSLCSIVSCFRYLFTKKCPSYNCDWVQVRTQLLVKHVISIVSFSFYTFKLYSIDRNNYVDHIDKGWGLKPGRININTAIGRRWSDCLNTTSSSKIWNLFPSPFSHSFSSTNIYWLPTVCQALWWALETQ